MTIIKESTEAQIINFIPREFDGAKTYDLKIKDETTNTVVFEDLAASFTELSYYKQYSSVFTGLKEDVMYILSIKNDSEKIIFKDKLFCTNQIVANYSINNNEYTIQSENNEFIVL